MPTEKKQKKPQNEIVDTSRVTRNSTLLRTFPLLVTWAEILAISVILISRPTTIDASFIRHSDW